MNKFLNYINKFSYKLNTLESPNQMGILRFAFGFILLFEAIRIFKTINLYFYSYEVAFRLPFTNWLPLFPEPVSNLIASLMIIASVFIIIGLYYRLAICFYTLSYAYFFFIDMAFYNNHYYLILLLCFIFLFINADYAYSLKLMLFPSKSKLQIPNWNYIILKFIIFWVYFCAGLVKLNTEWLSGDVMRSSLLYSNDYTYFKDMNIDFATNLLTYFGLIFDLSVGFLLLNNKTRKYAIIPILIFHITNMFSLKIGIFPYSMIIFTIIFIPPNNFTKPIFNKIQNILSHSKFCIEEVNYNQQYKKNAYKLVYLFILINLLLPFRHYLIKGNVDWTGEGVNFAWRMKSNLKFATRYDIFMYDKQTKQEIKSSLNIHDFHIRTSIRQPIYFIQIKDYLLKKNNRNSENTEVLIKVCCKFNMHEPQYLIDTSLDISGLKANSFKHNFFIN
ncbi:MAG: HTTM domain-containing protein [Chitinophagales bacterium]|nr:HTTM domain-containing protein [Chitinophagales bacterium]